MGIAQRMAIPEDVLNHWLGNDKQFMEELTRLLEKYIMLEQDGTLAEFGNRANATLIAILVLETKNSKRHPK